MSDENQRLPMPPVVNADGFSKTKYVRESDLTCPHCLPATGGIKLMVVYENQNSITMECPHCYSKEYARA